MPEPMENETREEFLSRCMGDSEAVADFKDSDQRFAFCVSVWERFKEIEMEEGAGDVVENEENGDFAYNNKEDGKENEGMREMVENVGPIFKIDKEKRVVYGIVLEPEVVDSQGDIISAEAIERAAHRFLIESRVIGESHEYLAEAYPVESFIAPIDFEMGGQEVRKGTWILAVKVMDDELWQKVKDGEFTGFSVGGYATRR